MEDFSMLEKTLWITTPIALIEALDETEKAYLVLWHEACDWLSGRQTWIPKSVIINRLLTYETMDDRIEGARIKPWWTKETRRYYNPKVGG